MVETLSSEKEIPKKNQYLENHLNKIQKGALSKIQNHYAETIKALNSSNSYNTPHLTPNNVFNAL
jgi:hypothetical protein